MCKFKSRFILIYFKKYEQQDLQSEVKSNLSEPGSCGSQLILNENIYNSFVSLY